MEHMATMPSMAGMTLSLKGQFCKLLQYVRCALLTAAAVAAAVAADG